MSRARRSVDNAPHRPRRQRARDLPGGSAWRWMQVPAGRIFLSYRRASARHLAGRLADRINSAFGPGAVFLDVDTIAPGADFRAAIVGAVSSCPVLLAVIDPQWSDVTDETGRRRLDDPE